MTAFIRPSVPLHVRRIVLFGRIAILAACCYFAYSMPEQDVLLTAAGILTFICGTWPMLGWLQRNDDTYPIFEFLLLITVPFYTIPLLTGHEEVKDFPQDVQMMAALVVLTFQLSCILGSSLAARGFRVEWRIRSPWWKDAALSEAKMHFTAYTAILNTLWLYISLFTTWTPVELTSALRAVFFGIGIISLFIQGRLWGGGLMTTGYKALFWINLTLQITMSFTSLVLIEGLGLMLTAALGYFSVARRVPWVPILLIFPIVALLHNGKADMRYIYWKDRTLTPKFSQISEYYSQWFEFGLKPEQHAPEESATSGDLTYGLMRRASLFHIVCVAVDTMPDRSPFLAGESYSMVPAQLVPRFFWPGKPSPQSSVRLLSIHFGIQSEEATQTTSIGFGLLSEAYANFGLFSVGALGFILGWVFRRLALITADCATLSPAGLLRILCLVWCLNAENTLAVWFSSFYQASLAIGFPLVVWKSLFND